PSCVVAGSRSRCARPTAGPRSSICSTRPPRPSADSRSGGLSAFGQPALSQPSRSNRQRGDAMKFGIFYEHQLPRPWESDDEHRLLKDALDQVELADRLGIDCAWEVEHHFLEEYSHSSAPEVFLAAASQRTSRIRLGHGIVQLPQGFNHSARVAERIATLDLVSDGRVDFGTGESSSEAELGGFNVDRATKRDQWDEATAVDRGLDGGHFFGYSLAHYYVFGQHRPGRTVIWDEFQKNRSLFGFDRDIASRTGQPLGAQLMEEGLGALRGAIGTPDQIRVLLRGYEAAGVDQ